MEDLNFEEFDCGIGRYVGFDSYGDYPPGFWDQVCPRKAYGGALVHSRITPDTPIPVPVCREHLDALQEHAETKPASNEEVFRAAAYAAMQIQQARKAHAARYN